MDQFFSRKKDNNAIILGSVGFGIGTIISLNNYNNTGSIGKGLPITILTTFVGAFLGYGSRVWDADDIKNYKSLSIKLFPTLNQNVTGICLQLRF